MHRLLNQSAAILGNRRRLRCDPSELRDYQRQHLRRLVRHAYRNVSYYRRLFDRHGLKPETIRGVEDLHLIPVTAKGDLQRLAQTDILSRDTDPARLLTFRTSGSSGVPLSIKRAPMEQLVLRALYLRSMRAMGLRPRDSIAVIASAHTTITRRQPLWWQALHRIDPRRRMQIDALMPIARIRERLRRFRPDVIIGYASLLARLAQEFGEEDRRLIRPRFLKADSEVLTPQMRTKITRAFGAPVVQMYDSHEFFMLAWECSDSGDLHVCDDGVILEVLKNGRSCREGERGEVVLTGLHSYAMPFIRYRLGDIVTKGGEACSCGLPFSTIRSVQGRMIDFFPLPDGRLLHPYEIVSVLTGEEAAWLGQYQLTQERKDRIVLQAVPLSPPPVDSLSRLEAKIKAVVGPGVGLETRLVQEIELAASGKFRVSRSLVTSAYDDIQWGAR